MARLAIEEIKKAENEAQAIKKNAQAECIKIREKLNSDIKKYCDNKKAEAINQRDIIIKKAKSDALDIQNNCMEKNVFETKKLKDKAMLNQKEAAKSLIEFLF